MLILLLNWLFIFITTYAIGYGGLQLLNKVFSLDGNLRLHPALMSLSGLAMITTAANYVSLFSRISLAFLIGLSLLSMLSLLLNWKNIKNSFSGIKLKNIHPLTVFFGVAFLIIAFIKSSGPTEIWDEGQYFLPLIRWIETYPAIPGTALFHDRMGYNSAFHMSSAVYSFAFWFKGGLYDLNSFLFILINFYFLSGINRILKKNFNYPLHDYLMLFACIALYRQLLTSMDSDYPHVFIGLVLLLLFIEKSDDYSLKKWDIRAVIILLLSFYLVTVKFLAVYFFLFLGVMLYFQLRQRKLKTIGAAVITGFLFILPWLVRNVILTGYLVYPVYQFDFFNVDWKIPLEMARNNFLYVGEHAKTLVERHTLYYDGATNVPVSVWLPEWWNHHATINISAVITAIVFPPTIIVLLILLATKFKIMARENIGHIVAIVITMIFLIFWFFQYPNVRFGWAWILFAIVFTLVKTNEQLLRIPWKMIRIVTMILFSLSLFRGTWKSVKEADHVMEFLVSPHEVTQLTNYTTKQIGPYEVSMALDMHCWGQTPPCMPSYYDPLKIVPRGKDIKAGFKLEK
ncbi:MAG: hypothetical protein H6571_02950 [Lewinellaceae bacterium]|nr:hypothetical protein [Lewinellaceae bacterium]